MYVQGLGGSAALTSSHVAVLCNRILRQATTIVKASVDASISSENAPSSVGSASKVVTMRCTHLDGGSIALINRTVYGRFCNKEGIGQAGGLGGFMFVPSGFLGWCCLLG